MKKKSFRFSNSVAFALVAVCIFLLLPVSCARQQVVVKPFQIPPEMKNILVVSFRNMSPNNEESGVRCSLSGQMFVTGPVLPDAESLLSGQLETFLGKYNNFKFISAHQIWDIQSANLSEGNEIAEAAFVAEAGRKLGADAVMVGHIYRFVDRVGGKYAAESPASVAFDLHIVRTADARVLWTGVFDETQKPLTDNLFNISAFLKRDGQWVTAGEMARAGLEQITEGIKKP